MIVLSKSTMVAAALMIPPLNTCTIVRFYYSLLLFVLIALKGGAWSLQQSPKMSQHHHDLYARPMSSGNFDKLYNKLAARAVNLQASSKSSPFHQIFIGISGAPGSGKSTLAQNVANQINDASSQKDEISIVLPMDGYHFSRAELERLGNDGKVMDNDSGKIVTYQDLMARRGAPWTFDSARLIRDFSQAKKTGQASLPTYSREISDPVPDGIALEQKHKIILCEGNYLNALDDANWAPCRDLWDEQWHITVPQDVLLERLTNRHLQRWTEDKANMWGQGREGAKAKAQSSDAKNAEWIEKNSAHHADLIIEHY